MLDAMRKAAGSWVAKLFFIVLVVSFAVWGIEGRIEGGGGGNAVLTVGKTTVSANEYRAAYDRQVALISQQTGRHITREQATAIGLDQQVLSQLAGSAVLDEQARRMGLGISEERVAELTRSDPAFQGANGQFDRQRFDYLVRESGLRPEDYLRSQGRVLLRQQIVQALSEGVKAPDAFLKAVALYRGEDRTVEYLTLPRSLVEPVEDPSDAELSAWFEKEKKRYAAPEYRKFSYVRMELADLADPSAISDEDVEKDYEANKGRYTKQETRTIEQIVFSTEAAAGAALDRIKGGATFDDIAKAEGKTPADILLGTFEKDSVPDKAVADAAFALGEGEVSPVVKGAFGPVLLRVTAITPESVRPLAEVREEIRNALAVDEASRTLLDVHDAYEDARAAGETLQEAADKLKLKVVTIDAIDRNGETPDGTIVKDIPQSAEVLKDVFESEVNVENPGIQTADNGFVFFEVTEIIHARDRTLDEVRQKVTADWKEEQAGQRLGAKAAELEKRLKDGASLDAIAAELNLEKQVKRGLKRGADDADLGATGVEAAFAVGNGGVGLAAAQDGGAQILFKVTEVFEPADASPEVVGEAVRDSVSNGLAEDLLGELVNRLQGEFGVTVDQTAMQRALTF